ncbi:bifunctional isocitrate dehydrogenase kinase/phosphatase [Zobellella denitrificans]|uniref:bifunctional isocitrate dehydrogenase kinase/phosphatase n=1 Tax=Zobellella denitrificans TaxID=347534 RepID=UPI000B8C1637|nr:bifunctional isocitrate dehydrogenase kinase/phosphatase [Zobellella denitrificans]OXS15053.1 bifunctional isocitrate dehydrogenase kinase/phosphatase [Zobellella denitrificans]
MHGNARELATIIMDRFDAFYRRFLDITQGAKVRFETRDWLGVQLAGRQRIRLYDHHVNETLQAVSDHMGGAPLGQEGLKELKQAFNDLLTHHPNPEIAESFYNSVYRRSLRHKNIRAENLYVHGFIRRAPEPDLAPYSWHYRLDMQDLAGCLRRVLEQTGLAVPFSNLERDLGHVRRYLEEQGPVELARGEFSLTFINTLFYRNKGAYLVGRLEQGPLLLPFILPILHDDEGGLSLDTLILSKDDSSILFGFARAYFMVWCPVPALLVHFLRPLLPNKADYEIYTAIGCQKHGKTEFYRHFLHHLHQSRDQFVAAPGIKGMVMSVFTLPSFDVVFKVIKDKFTPPKEVNHETVKAKYRLVKQHDRVGRMADTMEFTNFELPLHRISPELLAELQQVAPSLLTIKGDTLVIRHLYTERRMTPLNIYLEHASDQAVSDAVDEYANAIKQLAAANIFPGDMLFKNFGVTRHGRVIFYDYDEIAYMTECNFRDIPKARYPEDELSAEPWYSVGPNDIFPEEFATFLLSSPRIREAFKQQHNDLFSAGYWRQLQQNIQAGQFVDVFPYRRRQRFKYLYEEE